MKKVGEGRPDMEVQQDLGLKNTGSWVVDIRDYAEKLKSRTRMLESRNEKRKQKEKIFCPDIREKALN